MGALLPLLGTDFDMAQQGACEDILYDRLWFELATFIPQTTRKITRNSRSNTAAAYGGKQHAAAAAGGGMGPALDRGGTDGKKGLEKPEKWPDETGTLGMQGRSTVASVYRLRYNSSAFFCAQSVEEGFPVSTQLGYPTSPGSPSQNWLKNCEGK
jgi:hypothetical protein